MPYLGNTAGNRFVASKPASVYSGDGSTTAFTLEHAVGSDEDILVSVDGVIQEPSVAYAVSGGTTLTFTSAPSNNAGNNIFVYYLFRTVATVDHPSTSSLLATDGTFSGDLTVDTNTLYVDSANNRVGIGTGSPSAALHILDTSTPQAKIAYDSNRYMNVEHATIYNVSGAAQSNNLKFATRGYSGSNSITFFTGGTDASGTSESERLRIDSSGNLLVGTTDINPYDNTSGVGIALRSTGAIYNAIDGGTALILNRMTSDGTIAQFRQAGTTVGSIGTATNELEIKTSGTRYLELQEIVGIFNSDWTGNLQMTPTVSSVDLGNASTKWDNLYLSGGVYLGGTGSSNYLQDYEEGTWTPAVGGTATYSSNVGHYVKVGKFVTAWFDIRVTLIGTGSTSNVTGLPFTAQTNASVQGMGAAIGYFNSLATSVVNVHGRVDNSSATLSLSGITSAVTGSIQTTTILGNGARVTGSLIYETS